MSDKKFPTPNLDAWNTDEDNCTEFLSHEDAVQADIALAVEAAKVEVPEEVREMIEAALYHVGKCVHGCQKEVASARRWLESLRSASPAKPVEKRCGTCGHWDKRKGSVHDLTERGPCLVPVPKSMSAFVHGSMYSTEGSDCPCWKARTP